MSVAVSSFVGRPSESSSSDFIHVVDAPVNVVNLEPRRGEREGQLMPITKRRYTCALESRDPTAKTERGQEGRASSPSSQTRARGTEERRSSSPQRTRLRYRRSYSMSLIVELTVLMGVRGEPTDGGREGRRWSRWATARLLPDGGPSFHRIDITPLSTLT